MIGNDLLRAIQRYRIPFKPKFAVAHSALGEWESPFPGKGFEFFSARDFVLGDNPRRVHLPTSVRRGIATVIERIELRDMTIMVYLDCSPSMRLREKAAGALHVAAMLAFSAFKMESSFGFGALDNDVPIIKPRTGEDQFFSIFQKIHTSLLSEQEGRARGIIFRALIKHLESTITPRSMVFVVSDFLGVSFPQKEDEKSLRAMSRNYDIIPVIVQDEMEYDFPVFPYSVAYPFRDVESGEQKEVWLSVTDQRELSCLHQERFSTLQARFRMAGIQYIHPRDAELATMFKMFDRFFSQRR
jgi:uncharacterized protein (DUF58 family)